MEEINPTPQKPSTEQVEREAKRAIAKEALNRSIASLREGNREPYNKITEFGTRFGAEYPDGVNFVLFHDLIGSTLTPEEIASLPLDTADGEIERFIKTELAEQT